MTALLARPLPLVDKERRIVLLWSPKSACTTAYVWFSGLCGFLHEVRDFDPWPHNHREKIFTNSDRYKESLAADTSRFHVVRIIRDPYSRAVSIFRHAVRNRLIDQDSVSFREFLRTLARLDMTRANIHFRPQLHPFEAERKPDTVINISRADLFTELNALENRMGWCVTDFSAMAWLHGLEAARRPPRLSLEKKRLFAEPIVRSRRPRDTPFPEDEAFLTPQAKRLIDKIYRTDFEAYRDFL